MGCNSSAPAVDSPTTAALRQRVAPTSPAPQRPQRGPPTPAALPRSPRLTPDEEDPAAAAINPFSAALEAAADPDPSPADAADARVRALEGLLACPQQAVPTPRPSRPGQATRILPAAACPVTTAAVEAATRDDADEPCSDDDGGDPALVLFGFLEDAVSAASNGAGGGPTAQHGQRSRSAVRASALALRTEGVLHYSPHASPVQSVGSLSPVLSSLTTVGSF